MPAGFSSRKASSSTASPSNGSPAPASASDPSTSPGGKRPVSERKLAANRANAKKSTGPRTAEGRMRAALNAVKHGLTAQTSVLPGEDPEQLAEIKAQMLTDFPAANAFEASLVSRMIDINWRLIRAARAEESVVGDEYGVRLDGWMNKRVFSLNHPDPVMSQFLDPGREPPRRLAGAAIFGQVGTREAKSLEHICQMRNRLHNQMTSAIRAWVSLQKLPVRERPADARVVTAEDVLKERHRPPPPVMTAEEEQTWQAIPDVVEIEAAAGRAAAQALMQAMQSEDEPAETPDAASAEAAQDAADGESSPVEFPAVPPVSAWNKPVNWRAGLAKAASEAVAGKVEAALKAAENAPGATKTTIGEDTTEGSPAQNGPTADPPPEA